MTRVSKGIRRNESQQKKSGSHHATQPAPKTPNRSDTAQSVQDAKEKQAHPSSENALKSSQDKNPVPPATTRE